MSISLYLLLDGQYPESIISNLTKINRLRSSATEVVAIIRMHSNLTKDNDSTVSAQPNAELFLQQIDWAVDRSYTYKSGQLATLLQKIVLTTAGELIVFIPQGARVDASHIDWLMNVRSTKKMLWGWYPRQFFKWSWVQTSYVLLRSMLTSYPNQMAVIIVNRKLISAIGGFLDPHQPVHFLLPRLCRMSAKIGPTVSY